MKFETKFTKLFGTKYPVVGGTMMDISRAGFVAAISQAGALGVLASAIYKDYDEFRDELKAIKDRTDQPFAVNINLFPMMHKLDNNKYLEIMSQEGVSIVETSGFAPPEDLISKIKSYGMKWIHKCVGVRYAKKAEALGADAVTVVGYENGGATGNLNVTTMVLVPSTVDAISLPVIGGGGVVDSRTFLAVLALGASGAIMGTRLLLSEECPINRKLKEKLLQATETDTAVIMRSVGFAHRVWLNEPAKKVMEIESRAKGDILPEIYPYVSGESARKMFETGDENAGSISLSQGIGLIKEIKPVKDILDEMMEQAGKVLESLHAG